MFCDVKLVLFFKVRIPHPYEDSPAEGAHANIFDFFVNLLVALLKRFLDMSLLQLQHAHGAHLLFLFLVLNKTKGTKDMTALCLDELRFFFGKTKRA